MASKRYAKNKRSNLERTTIPGWIYATVGLIVILVSFLIQHDNNFLVFIAVGIIFFSVGLIKTIFSRHKKQRKLDDTDALNTYQQKMTEDDPQKIQVRCYRCGVIVNPHFRYCHNCGTRLKPLEQYQRQSQIY